MRTGPTPIVHTVAWDEAVSAFADGEEPGFGRDVVAEHLASCPRCRALAGEGGAGRGRDAGRAPELPPDLRQRVVAGVAAQDRAAHRVWLRAAVSLIGVWSIASALPDLLGTHGSEAAHHGGEAAHAARHLGSFAAAYGAGLLFVAFRPARARSMLPVAAVLAAALLITAVIDVATGHVPLVGEARHLPELASVALVWLLARGPLRSHRTGPGAP